MADVDVELQGGVVVKMPEEAAVKYREARTKDKDERDNLAKRVGEAKAEREAAEAKAARAESDKAAAEAMKKGELDKVREIVTKEHVDKLTKLTGSLGTKALREEVAKQPDILPSAVDDVLAQLQARVRFDADANSLVVLDPTGQAAKDPSTGQPIGADALVKDFLEKRPHFKKSSTQTGTGASQAGAPAKGSTITAAQAAEMNKSDPRGMAKFFAEGGKVSG